MSAVSQPPKCCCCCFLLNCCCLILLLLLQNFIWTKLLFCQFSFSPLPKHKNPQKYPQGFSNSKDLIPSSRFRKLKQLFSSLCSLEQPGCVNKNIVFRELWSLVFVFVFVRWVRVAVWIKIVLALELWSLGPDCSVLQCGIYTINNAAVDQQAATGQTFTNCKTPVVSRDKDFGIDKKKLKKLKSALIFLGNQLQCKGYI